jgi:2-C-methyl-D-erythritol 4-phosphate cytidylyltransferase
VHDHDQIHYGVRVNGPVWGLVLAGGGGTRFGGLKQFAQLSGQSLLERVVELTAAQCDGVVVVLPAGHTWPGASGTEAAGIGPGRAVITATGGRTRAESVRSGLAVLPPEAGIVVITDAAHPLASATLYQRVIAAVQHGADGALPGLPLADAIKRLEPLDDEPPAVTAIPAQAEAVRAAVPQPPAALLGLAGATTAAGGNVSAQMPMAFAVPALRRAHQNIGDAVEDSAMVSADGGRVVIVPGEPTNVHVTTPAELAIAEALLHLVPEADPKPQADPEPELSAS